MNRTCVICGSDKTYRRENGGKPRWHNWKGNTYCGRCIQRVKKALKRKLNPQCAGCSSNETRVNKFGTPLWSKINGKLYCMSCRYKGKKRPEHSQRMRGTGNPMYGKQHNFVTRAFISQQKILALGEEHHHAIFQDILRQKPEYKRWRKVVFERDNYTCQVCGEHGGRLHAHHIVKSFSSLIEAHNITSVEEALADSELWDVANGISICEKCHRETPDYLTHEGLKSINSNNHESYSWLSSSKEVVQQNYLPQSRNSV